MKKQITAINEQEKPKELWIEPVCEGTDNLGHEYMQFDGYFADHGRGLTRMIEYSAYKALKECYDTDVERLKTALREAYKSLFVHEETSFKSVDEYIEFYLNEALSR